jgi:alkylhydroperoxidase family enzyme
MAVEAWMGASLRASASGPFAAWDAALASVDDAVPAELVSLARTEVAAALGGAEPAARTAHERAVRALVDQFVVDVGSITELQRTAAFEALGDQAFGFMQVVYVCDLDARLRAGWRQLFGTEPSPSPQAVGAGLWSALEEFMRTVARMQLLDPLTSELVRLRGARAHRCRLCQSVRSIRAANDGADESVYDQIDRFESSALSPRHKTALRLVDAVLWQPMRYPGDLTAGVFEHFTPGETVELVFDIARNAANKIAVAFAADAPHVTEGIELYDIDERGDVTYGLPSAS